MTKNFEPSVYFVLDPSLCGGRDVLNVARAALDGGVTLLQYRDKTLSLPEKMHHAAALKKLAESYQVPFLVNDDVDVALEAGANGVHLGQGDMPVHLARAQLGEGAIIGQTAFTVEQIGTIDPGIVDYIGCGPFYPTKTKKGKAILGPVEAGGNGQFQMLAALSPVPVVGIGGITPGNAAAVIKAGADGVAMMRAIGESPDPTQTARDFVKNVAAARRSENYA